MRKRKGWIMKMALGGTLLFAHACERPDRDGVPPAPRVEDEPDTPGGNTSGGVPRTGPDTGPETPAP